MGAYYVFIGVLIYYLKQCAAFVEVDILLYQFEGRSHIFLFGLEGRAPLAGWESALKVDSMVTWVGIIDNDSATAVCVAMCCCTVSGDSCVKAIPVLLKRLHGYCMVRCNVASFRSSFISKV